jgi:hypothetical protein
MTFVVVLCKFYEVVVPSCGSLDRSYSRRELGPPAECSARYFDYLFILYLSKVFMPFTVIKSIQD